MLNGLPWKQTEIILSFLRLHPSTAFWTLLFHYLPTKVHLFKAVNHKGKQSWIFTGRTDAQAPMLWPLMQRTDSLERTLLLGKIEGGRSRGHRRWAGLMASSTQWTWVWTSSGRWWRAGKPGMLQSLGVTVRHDWVTEQQQQGCNSKGLRKTEQCPRLSRSAQGKNKLRAGGWVILSKSGIQTLLVKEWLQLMDDEEFHWNE